MKNFCLLFEGFYNVEFNGIFFLEYRFSFWRYWCFCIMQIGNMMTSYDWLLKIRKYWFNNISGNINGVIFKLGISNLSQKGSKITTVMRLPWQRFCYWSFSNINWNFWGSFTTKIIYTQKSIEEPFWQCGKYVCFNRDFLSHFLGLQFKIFVFKRERDWSQVCCHDNQATGFILFAVWFESLVPSLKSTTLIFPEIFLNQYLCILISQ